MEPRPHWPIVCLVLLLATPASTLAHDVRLLNVGARGGTSGLEVLGGNAREYFEQYDLFATASLPWSRYWESGWGFSTRVMGTAGVFTGASKTAFVGAIVPLLAFGPRDGILSLDAGMGAAGITRHKFGEQDLGGPFEVVLTFGLRVPVYAGVGIGYRMSHMSDATIYGPDSKGADIHMLELSYNFRR